MLVSFVLIFLFIKSCRSNSSEILSAEFVKTDSIKEKYDNSVEPTIKAAAVSNEIFTIEDPDGWSNLRLTPNGAVIQKVYEGDLFSVLSNENDFSKVQLENGKIGYILSSRIIFEEEYMARSEAEWENEENSLPEAYYTALVKRVYFYLSPNESSRINTFFVKGQECLVRPSENSTSGEFVYVSFEYKGVNTEGWVKQSEIGF